MRKVKFRVKHSVKHLVLMRFRSVPSLQDSIGVPEESVIDVTLTFLQLIRKKGFLLGRTNKAPTS